VLGALHEQMGIVERYEVHEGALGRAALEALGHPEAYSGLPPWKHGAAVLRLFRFVALGDYTAWAVGNPEAKTLVVRRITWDRDPKLNIASPALCGSHAEIPSSLLGPCLDTLRALLVPPFVATPAVGLDGTSYAVEVGSFSSCASLQWWEEGPPGWEALTEWFHSTVNLVERALPSREDPHGEHGA
jgi:hypothetical protein